MLFGTRRLLKIMGFFFGAMSIVMLIVSFFDYVHTRRFVDIAARGEGTVIKLVETQNRDSGTTYRPVFAFRDSKGREHEICSSVGSCPPAYKVGEKVSVLYNAEEPENAVLDGFFDVWLMSLIFGMIGTVQAVAALILLLVVPMIWKPQQQSQ